MFDWLFDAWFKPRKKTEYKRLNYNKARENGNEFYNEIMIEINKTKAIIEKHKDKNEEDE